MLAIGGNNFDVITSRRIKLALMFAYIVDKQVGTKDPLDSHR